MSPDAKVADLILHGWIPVRSADGWGLYNTHLGVGFCTRPTGFIDSPTNLEVLSSVRKLYIHNGEIAWEDMPDEVFDHIVARLAET